MFDAEPAVPRVLVVGAGAVGARVVRQLHGSAAKVLVHDIDPTRASALAATLGEPVEAVTDPAARTIDRTALDTLAVDVVVVATPRPQLHLAADALGVGADVVTTTDDVDDIRDLLELSPVAERSGCRLVVGAAMAPGLSGLLVRHLADRLDTADEAHVSFHGTGGPACARQHHRALAGIAIGWHDGEWVRRPAGSGRELCWFPAPIGGRDCYRAEVADVELLHLAEPRLSRISARISATRRDRLTAWLPMLSPPHREGGLGALRVEVRGALGPARSTSVIGLVERAAIASAALAATFATGLLRGTVGSPGLVVPGAAELPTDELLAEVVSRGIHLFEFVGDDGPG